MSQEYYQTGQPVYGAWYVVKERPHNYTPLRSFADRRLDGPFGSKQEAEKPLLSYEYATVWQCLLESFRGGFDWSFNLSEIVLEPSEPGLINRRYVFYRQNKQERVYLDYQFLKDGPTDWRMNPEQKRACLGVTRDEPKRYGVFATNKDCIAAGYNALGSDFYIEDSWAETTPADRPQV